MDILKQRQTIAQLRNTLMFKNNEIEDLRSKKKPDNTEITLRKQIEQLRIEIKFLNQDNAKKSKLHEFYITSILDQIQSAFNSDQKAYHQSIRVIKSEKQQLQKQKADLTQQLMNSNAQLKGLKNQINITSGKCLSLQRQIQKLSKPYSKSPNKQNTASFSNMHCINQQQDELQRRELQDENDIDNDRTYKMQ